MFIKRLVSLFITMLRSSNWAEDLSRIGNGLVIAGVATPALSDRGTLLTGVIVIIIGVILTICARA